jgi:hypothetical protein
MLIRQTEIQILLSYKQNGHLLKEDFFSFVQYYVFGL